MTSLSQMNQKELRAYVLSRRGDEEALHIYMDHLHNDPDVVRHTGAYDEEGLAKLEQLIEERVESNNSRSYWESCY